MSNSALIAADLIAITILVFGIYFPRHRRKDMVVAILGLNVGVMAVATTLSSAEVSAGLGLGLFGVLSIIRIRSLELPQEDIAYYFTALTIGLLGGISVSPAWVTPTLMATIIVVLFVADHPRLLSSNRTQSITLDQAYPNERAAVARLEDLLDAEITKVRIKKLDLVNDTTAVDICYKVRPGQHSHPPPDIENLPAHADSAEMARALR